MNCRYSPHINGDSHRRSPVSDNIFTAHTQAQHAFHRGTCCFHFRQLDDFTHIHPRRPAAPAVGTHSPKRVHVAKYVSNHKWDRPCTVTSAVSRTWYPINSSVITSADVMCSLTLVSLFVSRITQKYSTDFHKIRRKGGTLATEETFRLWWKFGSRYVKVRVPVTVRLGHRYTAHVSPGVCSTITILRHQQPRRRYALYRVPF